MLENGSNVDHKKIIKIPRFKWDHYWPIFDDHKLDNKTNITAILPMLDYHIILIRIRLDFDRVVMITKFYVNNILNGKIDHIMTANKPQFYRSEKG